ncbi:MAG: homoserine O-succinyltransferase [Deltaproteobacteria bacterium]|jgi:homoserine O-succinyltransferase/O-acetyltransferase|nr:homoserine O-succinyltransferase [Deltaproteobacteria bacterium]MBT4640750.1 homoserine O-succinyltransferase [Deltaproteobacteria bacterium]MBT6500040.1 homoserine O-succinyltransferase [Deltaproteobacteria bacterium]MBT6610699.1 homoserine O-succinyltransferase [Deltaproteobacteria bacterium]MBT7154787.1 homoserine O-succinyltransferase [Deltaproteobacteria bacterium]
MTIILPEFYHAKSALESNNITCISASDAAMQDIRPLRIGILNIMSNIQTYEFNLLYPLSKSILQIIPVWLKLNTYTYDTSSQEHLKDLYVSFKEAISDRMLDGLIITGASVEELEFEEIEYWDEVQSIIGYARKNIISTLGIGWGGMALAKSIGIDKTRLDSKLFGVYPTRNLSTHHIITGDLDDIFCCPQSRHSGYPDAILETERDKGMLNLLGYSEEAGYVIFETTDRRFLMHLGHPEYNSGRLQEENLRDQAKKRTDVKAPVNFNLDKPVNSWRSHRNEFFSQWIKYIYTETSYNWLGS